MKVIAIDSLVAAQAAAIPDAVAVTFGLESLSYQELDARANALAHRLRGLGVGPEVLVALCLRRSPAVIVAALGILKAGGAYLPLDPSYPEARLTFLLEDAQVPVLITERASKMANQTDNRSVIVLDGVGRLIDEPALQDCTPLDRNGTLQDLAYVIYTSGSTGQPKGVEISHGSLLNLVQWHQQAFQVTAADRATQIARVGFDAVVWEVWPYLAAGASLHLPGEEILNDPEALRDWVVEQEITITFMPTPIAERMLGLRWPASTSLRAMLTGADTLHSYPHDDLPFLFVNNYGPTECTVVSTSGLVPVEQQKHRLPPIGRPIANTRLFILDELRKQVPIGTPGELYIGGVGVARGYRNRPELTAERFILNPCGGEAEERLFKTGDLVRCLPDGQLSFLGRIDEQIKMRGFRIEPDEVAAAVNQHPGVLQSVIVARQTGTGEKSLIAYIVPMAGLTLVLRELRAFLDARLPDFMIPATFVLLESLPLTPNGKVDRGNLPPPDRTNTLRDKAFIEASSETERIVAAMVAQLLGLEQVDVEDNFFTMGGHSLLGTQLISRLREAFRIEMSLRMVFEAPTVAQLSEEIERLLLAKLENMSDAEAQAILNESSSLPRAANPM